MKQLRKRKFVNTIAVGLAAIALSAAGIQDWHDKENTPNANVVSGLLDLSLADVKLCKSTDGITWTQLDYISTDRVKPGDLVKLIVGADTALTGNDLAAKLSHWAANNGTLTLSNQVLRTYAGHLDCSTTLPRETPRESDSSHLTLGNRKWTLIYTGLVGSQERSIAAFQAEHELAQLPVGDATPNLWIDGVRVGGGVRPLVSGQTGPNPANPGVTVPGEADPATDGSNSWPSILSAMWAQRCTVGAQSTAANTGIWATLKANPADVFGCTAIPAQVATDLTNNGKAYAAVTLNTLVDNQDVYGYFDELITKINSGTLDNVEVAVYQLKPGQTTCNAATGTGGDGARLVYGNGANFGVPASVAVENYTPTNPTFKNFQVTDSTSTGNKVSWSDTATVGGITYPVEYTGIQNVYCFKFWQPLVTVNHFNTLSVKFWYAGGGGLMERTKTASWSAKLQYYKNISSSQNYDVFFKTDTHFTEAVEPPPGVADPGDGGETYEPPEVINPGSQPEMVCILEESEFLEEPIEVCFEATEVDGGETGEFDDNYIPPDPIDEPEPEMVEVCVPVEPAEGEESSAEPEEECFWIEKPPDEEP